MPGGRPRKHAKNISGLRNQQRTTSNQSENLSVPSAERRDASEGREWEPHRIHDSLKPNFAEDDADSDLDEESDWEDLEDEETTHRMAALMAWLERKCPDEEWLPPAVLRQLKYNETRRRPRPSKYKKGPDIGSKSARTKRRYKGWQTQGNLNGYVQSTPSNSETSDAREASELASASSSELQDEEEDAGLEHASDGLPRDLVDEEDWEDEARAGMELEEDVMEEMRGGIEVRDWNALRTKISLQLKKNHKQLTLAQINQLTILRNFATLRLKGYRRIAASLEIARQWKDGDGTWFARRVRALARHYQVFEDLPVEKRGGKRNGRSYLHEESVERTSRDWLTAQTAGEVTPHKFRNALNSIILPSLNVALRTPLCERTARRWLVKLGWSLTVLRKGVYMDGHEREDVKKYRQEEFLPRMAEFEARMDRYEGPELKLVPASLAPGEKKVIAIFHDECCFHVNDYKRTAWLPAGGTVLQKKGRGRLIHVSDFIMEPTGRLVLRNEQGDIIEDARKIIYYPGSNGDPWWDTAQLIVQIKKAIGIFDAAHPGCVALFIFDQSSAHASLPPDALRAFEMNKSNGGKQRKQRDTVIPMSNPDPAYRGKPQKMTLDDGQPKGLQQVLTERGFDVKKLRAKCSPVCPADSQECCMARLMSQQEDFAKQQSMLEVLITQAGHECIFLPKFHCELNPIEMYWGWSKYRYREVVKKNFDDAKQVALNALNSCPTDVIRRFIRKSWRFMSAYRLGLTGKAAAWAVRKQKQHRQVSRAAMMALEAVLNTGTP
ncbi:hypothetical protein K466DRAFT_636180 [Polyporus arcularius HHB13444]|uniref:Tc1-like transposase DDE domain-containing protein n=1 Tax=Polyporus arcularius HHB13444 TaxID=1314778 RepID=A0A5C3NW22_9APHY|nr:hypothetical protein K466DRAFT_636180 [Polyporus arcularius HHB13444]